MQLGLNLKAIKILYMFLLNHSTIVNVVFVVESIRGFLCSLIMDKTSTYQIPNDRYWRPVNGTCLAPRSVGQCCLAGCSPSSLYAPWDPAPLAITSQLFISQRGDTIQADYMQIRSILNYEESFLHDWTLIAALNELSTLCIHSYDFKINH